MFGLCVTVGVMMFAGALGWLLASNGGPFETIKGDL